VRPAFISDSSGLLELPAVCRLTALAWLWKAVSTLQLKRLMFVIPS